MGFYKLIREVWKKPKKNLGSLWKERLVQWRKEQSIVRLDRPTRIDKARSLGYKAKQGYIIVRVRVGRGTRKREKISGGRRSKHSGSKKVISKSYRWVSEERAAKKYKNCEVLNSYYLAEDGKHYWFEILLIDINSPVIKNDKNINWICNQKGRVFRGKTAAGKRSRGLLNKSKKN